MCSTSCLLAVWFSENNRRDVYMESTGKYWLHVHNMLEQFCNVILAHSKDVKVIRGKKIDKRGAKWIDEIFKHDLFSESFIPSYEVRQLRNLTRSLQVYQYLCQWEEPCSE